MDDPLVERLRADDCRPLLDRLRKKFERGEPLDGKIRLTKLTEAQRQTISAITGNNSRGTSIDKLTIDLATFSQVVVNTGRFDSLGELIELANGGPIENRRARRERHSEAWDEVWMLADGCVAKLGESFVLSVDRALKKMRQTGWLKRITKSDPKIATTLLNQAFDLLTLLPISPIPLAIFAARHTGDAHSLDRNQPLGRLLQKLISPAASHDAKAKRKSDRRRQIWESVGIVPDELSSSALVLNLPAIGDTLTDKTLRQHTEIGMPCRLTFRHLRLAPPTFRNERSNESLTRSGLVASSTTNSSGEPPGDNNSQHLVFVCENPSVIAAAADKFGSKCPAMICTEGQPTLTCWSILQTIVASGYRIKYHGDFDWGGIRIANKLHDSFGFDPWRFTADDHHITSTAHRKLRPPETEAVWDNQLATKIRDCGVSVEEESVLDDLLGDLSIIVQTRM